VSDEKLNALYKKAIEIEQCSKSPRLQLIHNQKLYCEVGLGTYYPESTKYMFISLNPGSNSYLNEQQNPSEACSQHPTFAQYLDFRFRYAINMRKIITAFAETKGISYEESLVQFGTTDLSIFHSQNTSDLKESFFVEVKESLPILIEDLSISKLQALILSGVNYETFFYNLYKQGSPIIGHYYKNTKQDWVVSFRTTLINNREYDVYFITHISATRGMLDSSLYSIGHELAKRL
jgi:hypothetical protein